MAGRKAKGFAAAAAVAAAVAGAYFFTQTKQGKKAAATMRGWAVRARGEVMERLEKMRNIDRKEYFEAIDNVLAKYSKARDVSKRELADLRKELRAKWDKIVKELKEANDSTDDDA